MGWRSFWVLVAALPVIGAGVAAAQTQAPSTPASQRAAPLAVPPPVTPQSAPQSSPTPPPAPMPAPATASPLVVAKVEAALENAMTLLRPGQIGLATIWDGNKFVQCRHALEHEILCEAAGTALQPSLAHVITLERAMRLATLAWTVDPHFGNYIHVVPASIGAKTLARQVLRALEEGYGADLDMVEVRSTWVRDTKCPPRNGPHQNLAGSIDDAPAMAATALHTCLYAPAVTEPARSVADLFGLYGLRVKGEVQRLIVNSDAKTIHLVLSSTPGYVQCAPDSAPPSI